MKRIHIICGMCGSDEMMSFKITDGDDCCPQEVFVSCENCSSLTSLDQVIKLK